MAIRIAAPLSGNPISHPHDPKHHTVMRAELQKHNTKKDCWIAIHGKVYDVSKFHDKHPGEGINDQYIAMHGGTDVTELFEKFHNTDEPFEWLEKAEHNEFPEIVFKGKLEGHLPAETR